jgi:hypothetical protein
VFRRRLVITAIAACALSACQWVLGLEGREVADAADGSEDASQSDGPDREGGEDGSVDAADARDARPLSCEAGTRACGSACVSIADDRLHCGGCDHDCLDAGCEAGLCAVEPEIVLIDRSFNGYFAANSKYFFVTDRLTTFTFDRAQRLQLGQRPYAPADEVLDGFEANENAVIHARRTFVSRMAAPSEQITLIFGAPEPGPPMLGLRVFGNRIFFVTAGSLYGGVETGPASLLVTIPNLTTAIAFDFQAQLSVYVSDDAGAVYQVPSVGGAAKPYATGVPGAVVAAAVPGFLVFASRNEVWSIQMNATPKVAKKIYAGATWISHLRVANLNAYVLDRGAEEGTDGRLVRVPIAGGDPNVLLKDLSAPLNLHLDPQVAYTLDRGRQTPSPHTVKIIGVPR